MGAGADRRLFRQGDARAPDRTTWQASLTWTEPPPLCPRREPWQMIREGEEGRNKSEVTCYRTSDRNHVNLKISFLPKVCFPSKTHLARAVPSDTKFLGKYFGKLDSWIPRSKRRSILVKRNYLLFGTLRSKSSRGFPLAFLLESSDFF